MSRPTEGWPAALPLRTSLVVAAGATLLAIALTACAGGGAPATPTPTSAPDAYYAEANQRLLAANHAFGAIGTGTDSASVDAGIATLRQLADALAALAPPPEAKAAQDALVVATRALADDAERLRAEPTVNDETAEALVLPSLGDFYVACTKLARAAQAHGTNVECESVGGDFQAAP